MPRFLFLVSLFLGCTMLARADDKKDDKPADAPASKVVEKLAETARKSVVVITFTGRDGKRQGLGTGFIVSADGLVATNLHVIGEARPIQVELADGKRHDVTVVHASDRNLDLALVKIDAKDLAALPLGDSEQLKQGQAVVALGNPHGLKHSVVSGVVSGKREIDGRQMIQIAIPIESGNSGGPLLDLDGKVHGIITMKSLVTANLGFAVPINALKALIKKPNPVPMARWLTIGTLDPDEWTPLMEARWKQRGGLIKVEGAGSGFGGRSLCLCKRPAPDVPYEAAVSVKLDDEAGAAGLAFAADGGDKHFGFYPSGGKLRLTRFDGPDVYSWKILRNDASPHYRAGEWNTLKVRVEKDKIICFVNGERFCEVEEAAAAGKVGLAKFRDTQAEFKSFQVAKEISPTTVPAATVQRITKAVEKIDAEKALKPQLIDGLAPDAPASMQVLRERAKLLEQQAAQLRMLAAAVHQKRVLNDLADILKAKEEDVDLFHAAILIARLDNDELDIEPYRKEVERMARDIGKTLAKDADDKAKLAALNKYLFSERGFHGSRSDYYNRSNSYLNEVLDDREGLPITLAVVYMEVGRRLGLKIVGVPLPGHFVVKHVPAKGEPQLIDAYETGKPLTREEAAKRVEAITERPLEDRHLQPATKKAILVRMLHNLLSIARSERDVPGLLRYLDAIITITPDAGEERWTRAVLRFQTGQLAAAREDTAWLIDHQTDGIDTERVLELRRLIDRQEK